MSGTCLRRHVFGAETKRVKNVFKNFGLRRFLIEEILPEVGNITNFLGNRYWQEKLDQCRRLPGMQIPDRDNASLPAHDYRDR